MRNRRINIALFFAGTSWLAIACSSGSGPLAVFGDPYDPAPDSRDKPPDSRDNPLVTGDTPPASTENPGTFGGGPSSASGCPPCNGTWKCTSTLGNQMVSSTLVLVQSGSQCQGLDSKGKPSGTLSCTGAVTDEDGKSVGTWQSTGGDGFTVTSTTTQNKATVTITTTCTKQSNSTTPPTPTTTATPTVTGTPAPTPTPTVTDGGTILDAATKG